MKSLNTEAGVEMTKQSRRNNQRQMENSWGISAAKKESGDGKQLWREANFQDEGRSMVNAGGELRNYKPRGKEWELIKESKV